MLAGQEGQLHGIDVLLAHLGGSDLRGRHQSLREVCLLRFLFLLELYRLEADDGEVLDEPLLDLLEAVVVVVELFPRVREEGAVPELVGRRGAGEGRRRRPRNGSEPFELRGGVSARSVTAEGDGRSCG